MDKGVEETIGFMQILVRTGFSQQSTLDKGFTFAEDLLWTWYVEDHPGELYYHSKEHLMETAKTVEEAAKHLGIHNAAVRREAKHA